MKTKIYKIVINFLIISAVLVVIIIIGIDEYKEKLIEKNKIEQPQYDAQALSIEYAYQEENKVNVVEEYPKEQIIEKYEGYQVAAKLEIPEINLETYVLQEYSNASLNISVTKFWGANPNEIGNCCIAGHNFIKRNNMFHNLKKLEIGDKFFVSDNKIGKVEYEIYDLYKVYPEDVSCLSQETNGNREVTLITCTNDSKKRIIIKAKEVKV